MRRGSWMRFRANRLIVIFIAIVVYIALAFIDALQTFSHPTALHNLALPIWLSFGFSLSVALIFLAVGSLTWFYSRNRQVSFLLFIYSSVNVIAFELETSSYIGLPDTRLASIISSIAGSAAITLLAAVLLVFPKDYLMFSPATLSRSWLRNVWSAIRSSPIRWYIFLLILTLCFGIVDDSSYLAYQVAPLWLDVLASGFRVFALTGSLITIIISFRKSTTREREQLRFFVGGVILALTPLLLLTVIPQTISARSPYYVDAQITTLTVILLPISLGYSILRYQILVFDTYIRRTVSSIIGTILLVIVAYIVYIVGSRLLGAIPLLVVGGIVIVTMAVLAPITWWFAKQLTERVLFKDTLHYRRMIDKPVTIGNEELDLENIGQLITEAAMQTFKTPQVNLFVLAKDKGCYSLFPELRDEQNDDVRHVLASHLASSLSIPTSDPTICDLVLQETVEKRLVKTRRPLLLYELTRAEEDMPTGLSRYLTSSLPEEQNDPLIAPIRVQGRMIALLVLGERSDAQSYAGPDFEIVEALISRYAPILETARMTEQLRAAYERQKELDVLKDQFITTASHELRTPLTAVLGYIGLLKEHNETLVADMRAKFIAKAELGCDELVLMVNNIMDASRIQVDVNNTKITPVLLQESVVHIVEIMEAIVRRERRSITVDVPSDIVVMADAMRLRQVLLNLVSNALKYSPHGTNIEIWTKVDTEYVTICVRDYGAGVPPEAQTQLFERFMRLERDMNSPTRGAGLGLYICRQLVEAMSGNIWVESSGKAGEGSWFFFTLQLAPAQTSTQPNPQQNLSALA